MMDPEHSPETIIRAFGMDPEEVMPLLKGGLAEFYGDASKAALILCKACCGSLDAMQALGLADERGPRTQKEVMDVRERLKKRLTKKSQI